MRSTNQNLFDPISAGRLFFFFFFFLFSFFFFFSSFFFFVLLFHDMFCSHQSKQLPKVRWRHIHHFHLHHFTNLPFLFWLEVPCNISCKLTPFPQTFTTSTINFNRFQRSHNRKSTHAVAGLPELSTFYGGCKAALHE